MFKVLAGLLLVSILASPALAASPDATGAALGVDPAARAEAGKAVRELTVGADIFIGDKVVTDAAGLVQIRFSDRTELVVGPNSALTIEDYLLRNDGSAGKLAVDALAGTFRFITGGASKDRYLITTPTGTIAVRGTAFDFTVTPGRTTVLLYHGAVTLCGPDDQCVVLENQCDLGAADTKEAMLLGHTDTVSGAAREALKASFPYAISQMPLLRPFRVDVAERCFRRPAGVGPASEGTAIGDGLSQPRQRGKD